MTPYALKLIEQIPKELPREFGIELYEIDHEVRAQLKLFAGAMISLGYTVYQWYDTENQLTKFKFRK